MLMCNTGLGSKGDPTVVPGEQLFICTNQMTVAATIYNRSQSAQANKSAFVIQLQSLEIVFAYKIGF